jgi:thiamine pyrophosphokinase
MNPAPLSLTAVVVADAPVGDLLAFRDLFTRADLIIAADGGARHLLALDLLPQLAVGDFDSLEPELLARLQAAGVEIRRHSRHKNETDLELALLAAIERGAAHVYVLAALGGRPDQHLANLQLLAHPALAAADVRLLHRGWEVFVIRSSTYIIGTPGDTVSLLPMTDEVRGIVTDGLYYPLRSETLRLGPARGVSNVLVDHRAQVRIEAGLLLCMHETRDEKRQARHE